MGLKFYKKEGNEGKAKWILADEHNPPINMVFETVLSFESNPADLESSLDQKYFGPFYIDIDNEDSLEEALRDTKQVVKYLAVGFSLKPDTDLKIFATGKKGFHIEVNPSVFMDSKFKPLLPYRYKLMAAGVQKATNVKLDMVVYSGKKGRMWRIPNVQRSNGNFKVELSYEEILVEDIDFIEKAMLAPRKLSEPFKKVARNALAESWFKASEITIVQTKQTVADEALLNNDVPDCIAKLKALDAINSNARFNSLVLNAATYGARIGWDTSKAYNFFKPMLDYPSSVYKTVEDKKFHFENVYGFVAENEDYKFDCGFICKVVDNPQCNSCPVKLGDGVEEADAEFGIFVKNNNYYMTSPEGARRLTGFVIKIIFDVVMESGEVLYDLKLTNARGRVKHVTVPEHIFSNKAGFSKYLSPDFPIWCSERELAMIAWHLRKDDPNEQVGRDFIGLHWIDNSWHYANEHGSISLKGDIDRVKVNAKSLTIVNTKLDFDWPSLDAEETKELVENLLNFNVPQVVVPIVGWFLSAFLKPHFDKEFSQFPLLFLFGEAGAGKTSSGLVCRRLFAMADSALKSIADVTQFSLMAACNSSNLVPLILDEYKPMMMKEAQAQLVSRLIRGAYNSSRGERGTATQEIIPYYYRAPIMLLGEQSIIETAVQHRVIEVQLTRAYLQEHPECKKHLDALRDQHIESLGKDFLSLSMSIKPSELKTRFNKHLEVYSRTIQLPERPVYNHTVLRTTFDFFIDYLQLKGLNMKEFIDSKFLEYERHVKQGNSIIDSILNKNDVVKILDIFNLLADIQASPFPLLQNVHYSYSGAAGELYLDLETIFPLFSKYNMDYKLGLYDMGSTSFMKMLQKEPFCKSIGRSNVIGKKFKLVATLDIASSEQYKVNLSNLIPPT